MQVWALDGIAEVAAGDDLATIIGDALAADAEGVVDGDILVVTSKIVSKAEGRQLAASDREDAITAETVRVVAVRGTTRIVENRLGVVGAAAGVDASNTPEGTILLLPIDPDASARALCAALRERFGVRLGIVVSDTLGRAWRIGQTDIAIGAAGMRVVDDLRGETRPLVLVADDPALAAWAAASELADHAAPLLLEGGMAAWRAAGLPLEATPALPSDADCIDYLFFVHDRHDGNKEAARRYLAWETGLVAQLDAQERAAFRLPGAPQA
jgi:coenzyme F420-0:L-glutamate ligase/coenzyme F420-1:gamma-L-glutamate ligase